ncbi:hypothetical protein Vadar_000006 [Vaccinium darrowii]|uniref:Uncharacterized protein n=1 Tax=Vaccinium darrowii TaxID=229202 RepID=A0ACB7WVX1_9ERIC|nr:hypothetical protein Vadar_000006 [Vaccinium darrowii]
MTKQHTVFTSHSTASEFSSHAYAITLQNCVKNNEPTLGKALHCDISKRGGCLDLFGWNVLFNTYVKTDLLSDARKLFDEMTERNTGSYVTMMQGCAQSVNYLEAVDLFVRLHREGLELNSFVFTSILKLLVSVESGELCRSVHACLYKLGHKSIAFVGTSIIDAYSACGLVDDAREAFDEIIWKDMVSWTGMLLVSVESEELCRSVHACLYKLGHRSIAFVGTSIIDAYSACGLVDDAREAFDEIIWKDMVSWTGMVTCYAENGDMLRREW